MEKAPIGVFVDKVLKVYLRPFVRQLLKQMDECDLLELYKQTD